MPTHREPLTWLKVQQLAYSELDIHPWELDEYDTTDFVLKLEGQRKRNSELFDQTRWLAFITIKPHLKNPNLTIDQVFPKGGDKKKVVQSARELRERILKAAAASRN